MTQLQHTLLNPACGACYRCDSPCTCEAAREYWIGQGHQGITVDNGPVGGPYTNYFAQEDACLFPPGSSQMSGVDFPAYSLGPYSRFINSQSCFTDILEEVSNPVGSNGFDHWDIGAGGEVCIGGVGNGDLFSHAGLDRPTFGPISIRGTITYYCENNESRYDLEIRTSWNLFATYEQTLAIYDIYGTLFPNSDGVDYTHVREVVFPFETITYTRNDGMAELIVRRDVSGAFGRTGRGSVTCITQAKNPTTEVTQWSPGIDFSGISETGRLAIDTLAPPPP